MESLFSEILYRNEKQEDTVLVTIIAEKGSTPRGLGSQMLVGQKGRLWGSIGGGAVEHEAVQLCKQVCQNKKSLRHEYRLRENNTEDIGMVCGGDVTVWLQYVPANAFWQQLSQKALEMMEKEEQACLAFSLEDSDPALIQMETGDILFGNALVPVSQILSKETNVWFGKSLTLKNRVLLFGAGHISRALVPLLNSIGFKPVVFDNRPDYTKPEDFPGAQVICGDYEQIQDTLSFREGDYVAILTNGHAFDYVVEKQVLQWGNYAYLGVVGSRHKTESVNARLKEDGIGEEQLKTVHTPIGVAIKAVTPEEIAVSIAGEMIYERALKREGNEDSIHHRCPV